MIQGCYNKCMTGKDIIELRLRLGETQAQFAKRFSASYVTIGRWERGLNAPQPIYVYLMERLKSDLQNKIAEIGAPKEAEVKEPVKPFTKANQIKGGAK